MDRTCILTPNSVPPARLQRAGVFVYCDLGRASIINCGGTDNVGLEHELASRLCRCNGRGDLVRCGSVILFNTKLGSSGDTEIVPVCLRSATYVALISIVAEVRPTMSWSATYCRAYVRAMGVKTSCDEYRSCCLTITSVLPVTMTSCRCVCAGRLMSRL